MLAWREADRQAEGTEHIFRNDLRRIAPSRISKNFDSLILTKAVRNKDTPTLNPVGAIAAHPVERGCVDKRSR